MGRPLGKDLLDSISSRGRENVHYEEEWAHVNDTLDWYFPLHFRAIGDSSYYYTGISDHAEDPNIPWTWRGIHHLSPTHLKPMCLSLPSFNLPLDWIRGCNPRDNIIASTHGLLLLKLETREVSEMDALRRPLDSDRPNLTRWRHPKFLSSHEAGHEALGERWTPLMVYNPLRTEWRILPAMSPQEVGMSVWDYRYVQASLMVNEMENSYKVVLVFLHSVCVYTSREKTWTCHRFCVTLKWGSRYRGLDQVQPVAWRYQGTSACVDGRVLLLDLSVDFERELLHTDGGLIQYYGFLNLFVFDEEEGYIRLMRIIPLDNLFPYFCMDENKEQIKEGHQGADEEWDPGFGHLNPGLGRCSYSLEVVECMGNLFAIILALLMQSWKIRNPHKNFVCMPLQFHIFDLRYSCQDGVGRRGVLRIQIPRTQGFINCKCDNCTLGSIDGQRPHRNSAL